VNVGHSVFGIAVGSVAVAVWAAALLLTRCRHPHPHYERAVQRRDPQTGESVVVRPARYECFECGRHWTAVQRDPAWAPSPVVQRFTGYDETQAKRAAMRAAIEEHQRRVLAAHRAEPSRQDAAAAGLTDAAFVAAQPTRPADKGIRLVSVSKKPA
jgi:hypothetical protein